ncbi:MAG: nitrite reductase [Bacteroidota bacterium]
MQSFRTELENPVVEKEILDLEKKIFEYRNGKIPEEKFRSLRLARGVYGQRQKGVQMVRIKLPFGRLTARQLDRIADIADEYSNGNLHLTTRQDVQVHFVSLERTPELWAKLAKDDVTLREACGNTVRNVTASETAGIDPREPFDVSPYAEALSSYFLRQPFDQDLPRKIKIAFSSSDEDTAFTFIHDIGFIPRVKIEDGTISRGFKVLIGGGLGAQPFLAQAAREFLPEDQVIPFTEAVIRVFDRYGERANRHKARIKYLLAKIGLAEFLRLVDEESLALKTRSYSIDRTAVKVALPEQERNFTTFKVSDDPKYREWIRTNTFEQRQQGFFGVYVKVLLGNISSARARQLARIAEKYAADDIRVTITQNFLLRFVPAEALPALFRELSAIGLAETGYGSLADITACPGTDTCNLGISSSTGIAKELERVIRDEYPELIYEKNVRIKISGCMNSCGQHSIAQIGFHGSSLKKGEHVVPALQVLLGGGVLGKGSGRIAEKVIKVPSKRGPAVLRTLLDDFGQNGQEQESFNDYYDRRGNHYFYNLLKIHANELTITDDELIDWGQEEKFRTAIGVGECAGVQIDLVATLFFEADEKLLWAGEALEAGLYADAVYHAYSAFIHSAKALLAGRQVHAGSQIAILGEFDRHFTGAAAGNLSERVLRINKHEPTKDFALAYVREASDFAALARSLRSAKKEEAIV